MREAALVPLPAIAGSEEAAPGDSGLLAREVVASAVGVAVARLGAVRLAAGLVAAVLAPCHCLDMHLERLEAMLDLTLPLLVRSIAASSSPRG